MPNVWRKTPTVNFKAADIIVVAGRYFTTGLILRIISHIACKRLVLRVSFTRLSDTRFSKAPYHPGQLQMSSLNRKRDFIIEFLPRSQFAAIPPLYIFLITANDF